MKLNHPLLHKSKLEKLVGLRPGEISRQLSRANGTNFTDKEEKAMYEELVDMFCYVFEVDDMKIEGKTLTGFLI